MYRYFFHQYVRGQKTEDPHGTLLPTDSAACHRAVQRMPTGLKGAELESKNTYVATEVTDGKRTLFVVRGSVIVEKWSGRLGWRPHFLQEAQGVSFGASHNPQVRPASFRQPHR
ncbi:DUF6894 family protein [Bradyrhizobium genosp. P]|uniref:DUF6894 family protein n=1 Tax=Bradyrhizobium genosp. P TaxID=83641 RepID=UPI003CF7BC98